MNEPKVTILTLDQRTGATVETAECSYSEFFAANSDDEEVLDGARDAYARLALGADRHAFFVGGGAAALCRVEVSRG